ncbi:tyrosine-type recombinase/integrase [Alteribacter aurantiacus]|uniref:tyrosine-type recombinase/integrase n=1 Tax=Alteribacter aurantiacus TaxID=254410 RepID=UPI0003FF6238|nr:tyrosine-type recombinase/integrase [Alteribacter aurantiacus]
MKYVEPIKNIQKIHELKQILLNRSRRDYCLFVMGINTGLRITELLHSKVSDVYCEETGRVLDFLSPETRKGTSYPHFYLNDQVKQAVGLYLSDNHLKSEDFLFCSAKTNSPITRQQAYRVIHAAAREAGIEHNVGTHTMRKTFGYHAYRKGVAISLLQKILKHASKSEAYVYLGIDPSSEEPVQIDVNL